ncbi:MAG: hypothetical protein WAQ53_02470 [Thiofilum sp.]|uniref:hypothetical protein n=1 Tax=Thiofilum sp. TaxID=2212733 RepID=UPI0025F22628|nr:hypothetical protein [Thiofilum sp.]MBK8454552.1 hypothetical protein [Thiofilum sp.]
MLTLDDCREFCGLNECQLRAIEYSAHLTHIEALALAQEADHDRSACLKVVECLYDFSDRACRSQVTPYSRHEMSYSIRQYMNTHPQFFS